MMVKLKLQYFGHLMWSVDSLEKTLMLQGLGAGGKGDNRGWDGWMASLTQWTWIWVNSGSWWWTGRPGVLRFMGLQRVGHDWATELNWTDWKMLLVLFAKIYVTLNGKGICRCDIVQDLEMGRLPWIIWMGSVESRVFLRGRQEVQVMEKIWWWKQRLEWWFKDRGRVTIRAM